MPKELTHIQMAELLFGQLPDTSLFKYPIKNNYDLFLYGALVADTFYYYTAGPKKDLVNSLSNQMHIDNESSLLPVIRLLSTVKKDDSAALAFAAGICCHLVTDTVFHPLVFYYSGIKGLHPGADTRHRRFETLLDLYIKARYHIPDFTKPFKVLKKVSGFNQKLFFYLKAMFGLDSNTGNIYLRMALFYHGLAYFLFTNRLASPFFHWLYKKELFVSSEFEALFYPVSRPDMIPFFSGTLDFKHPVSGEKKSIKINDLTQQVFHQSSKILSLIEIHLNEPDNLNKLILNDKLPRIQPNLSTENFKYWYRHPEIMDTIFIP